MFEFTIENTKFKIAHSPVDDVVALYQADSSEKWKWIMTENTDKVEDGRTPVIDFIIAFLVRVNKKLSELFGDIVEPPEFKTPLEELKFRIDNNLTIKDGVISLTK